jgi:hypothetical protein
MKNTLLLIGLLPCFFFSSLAQNDEAADFRLYQQVGPINDVEQINELFMRIPLRLLSFKDTLNFYAGEQVKTIGNLLLDVYPQAVKTDTGYVPDIFAYPKSFNYNATTLICEVEMNSDHGLAAMDKIRILDSGDRVVHAEVDEVIDESIFRMKLFYEPEQPFIYGRWVDDIKTVDYESLLGLNMMVTQELLNDFEQLNNRVEELEVLLNQLLEERD